MSGRENPPRDTATIVGIPGTCLVTSGEGVPTSAIILEAA